MTAGGSTRNAVILAVAIIVLAGGGSFIASRSVISAAKEEGKELAGRRAKERVEQRQVDMELQRQRDEQTARSQRLTALLETLEDSLKTHPLDSMMVISAGNISYDLGKFEKAAIYYETFLSKIDPSNTAVRVDFAYSLYKSGRAENGIAELKRILASYPNNQSALFNLAVMHLELGNTEQALEWFTKCQKADPQSEIGKRAAIAVNQLKTTT